ncbi:hypothetical protein ACE0DR_04045 [Azotobacter sp. CWF10]
MSNFPKRKILLSGSLALVLGAALQLPALAAHHEHKEDSGSTEDYQEQQGRKGGTMGGERKMEHDGHEKRMEEMHEQHMQHDDEEEGDTDLDRRGQGTSEDGSDGTMEE